MLLQRSCLTLDNMNGERRPRDALFQDGLTKIVSLRQTASASGWTIRRTANRPQKERLGLALRGVRLCSLDIYLLSFC